MLSSVFFLLLIFARRGKRWIGRERVSERFSFARARVMCIHADEEILRAVFSLAFFEREEGLCAKFYARRQRRKREGGMGSRALDLCSGAFFARDDDDSRSGMIDGGRSVGVGFDFLFLCLPLFWPMGSSLALALVFWILICANRFFSLLNRTNRHCYATRSNKIRKLRLPGGKLGIQYVKKKTKGPQTPSGDHGKIHGVPHLRTQKYSRKHLAKNKKTVNRAYGGVLSGGAVRERIVRAFLVEEQKIVKKVLKLQANK